MMRERNLYGTFSYGHLRPKYEGDSPFPARSCQLIYEDLIRFRNIANT